MSKHPCPIDIVRGGEDIVNTASDLRGAQKCNSATRSNEFLLQGDTFSMEIEQDMLRCFFFQVREILDLSTREKGQKLLQMFLSCNLNASAFNAEDIRGVIRKTRFFEQC